MPEKADHSETVERYRCYGCGWDGFWAVFLVEEGVTLCPKCGEESVERYRDTGSSQSASEGERHD